MNRLAGVVAVAVLAASASGCARLFARSLGPPLGMPAPPARVVPIESQPIVAAPTVDDVPSRAPEPIAPTPPAPPPARVDRSEPAPPARTEAPADTGAAAAPAPVPTPPPPTLQTTANPTEAEQRARAALENARRDLGRIDVRRLSTDARAQYDIARRFVQQAEDALKNRNPVFAEPLADKAAQIAALLQRK